MSNVGVNIKIGADSSAGKSMIEDFRNQFKALVDQIKSTALEVKVQIKADSTSLTQEIQQIKTALQSQMGVTNIKLGIDVSHLQSELVQARNLINTALSTSNRIRLNIDISQVQSQINQVRTLLNAATSVTHQVNLNIDLTRLQAQLAQVRTLLSSATRINHQVSLSIDLTRLQAQLNAARAQLASMFGAQSFSVRLGVNLAYLQGQLAAARAMIIAAIANIGSLGSHINVNIDATAPQLIAAINNLKAEIDRLRQAMVAGRGAGSNGGGGGSPSVVGGVGGLGGQIAGIVASLGSLMGMGAFLKVTDEAKRFEGQLRLVTDSEQELISVRQRLLNLSNASGASMASSVELYTKMYNSTRNLNGANSELLVRVTDVIQKFVAIGGSTGESANAAIIQLSQGLGSGTLRGEELNSVIEQTPGLAKGIADGLGVTVGQLKKMGEAGEITTDQLINGLLKMGVTADEMFAKLPVQSSKALTSLFNDFKSKLAQFDKNIGFSESVVKNIQSITTNLSEVLEYVVAIGAATGITLFAAGIVMAGKALAAKTIQLKTALFAEVERTKAVLAAARAELTAANATVTGATAREIATRGTTAHAAATIALADAMVVQRNATIAATAAQNAATAAASRGALVARGLTLALGGPLGLLLIIGTLASAFLTMRDNGEEANTTLEKIGTTAEETQKKLEGLTKAQVKALRNEAQQATDQKRSNLLEVAGRASRVLASSLSPGGRNLNQQQSDFVSSVGRGEVSGDQLLAFAKNAGKAGDALTRLENIAGELDTAFSEDLEARTKFKNVNDTVKPPKDVGTVTRKDVDPKIDQTERERIRLTAAIEAEDNYTAQKRANIVSLGNLEITALEAARVKQQGNATELGKIENQIYEQQFKNQNALKEFDKRASDEKSDQLVKVTEQTYKAEKDRVEQEIRDTESLYKNEEISFGEMIDKKDSLNKKLYELETKYLKDRVAQESDAKKSNALKGKQKELDADNLNRDASLSNEVMAFAKEMKAYQEKTLDQYTSQEISLASDLLGSLNVELLSIGKTYNDAKKSIDDLRKKVGSSTLNYQFADGTTLTLNKALLDQWQAILDRQEAIAREAATKRAAAEMITKDSQSIIDRQRMQEDAINRANVQDGGWQTLTANRAINDSRNTAYNQLDNQRQGLIGLRDSSFGSEADELQKQIDTLTEKMQGFKELIPTTFQAFTLNLKQAATTALASGLEEFFTSIVDGSQSAGDALENFVKGFIKAIAQIIIQAMAAYAALLLLEAIPGGRAVATALDIAGSAKGVTSAKVQHTGGIAGAGGTRRNIDTSAFLNAPRYHVGGIAGLQPGEIPAILEPGEEVLTRDDPRHAANGGGQSLQSIKIVNSIDPGVIHDNMSSSSGEQVIMNVITRNIETLKGQLG